ncbi:MAG TPA: RodZ domain-containing protein [Acidobacteriota bacterium]
MSLGSELRDQRQSRNISLDQIQASTKISIRFLEAIEADQFDRLPGGVFNRGFLRGYCEAVGLDAERFVRRYDTGGDDPAADPVSAHPPISQPQAAGRRDRPWRWLGPALGATALFGWWLGARPPTPTAPPDSSPPAAARPAPAAPAAGAKLQIGLQTQGESWAEIHVDGERRIYRILQPEETLKLEADRQVRLTLGNPAAVALRLQGEPASWRQPLSRPIHALTITPENAAQFLLTPQELAAGAGEPSDGQL